MSQRERAEADIRSVFESGTAAWNRGDIDGYLEGYWNSQNTRWISGGTVIHGRDAIAKVYKTRFASRESMGRLEEASDLQIEVLTSTDAMVFGRWVHTLGETTRRGVFTAHLKKIEEDWRIVSDHTSTNE